MAPQYKLTYFDVKGIAEPIRFTLKYANIDFIDERHKLEDWEKLKPTFPFGQLPVLTVNGKVYTQSLAILRFFAKQAKLNGKDAFEDMEIESVIETVNDFRIKMGTYFWEKDPQQKEKLRKPLFEESIPFYMERLEKIAKENQGHLACKRLTYADFFFTAILDYCNHVNDNKSLVEKYPNLQQVCKTVRELPAIKKWIAERPQTFL